MLDKTFTPADAESRLYEMWERSGAFQAGRIAEAKPYCIVIPPPNVTGRLHIGHALNITLQDILVRFERMRGRDVLWQPGTDHAGIATQMVVERLLESENRTDRRTMGREAFVRRVWQWKEESGGTIVRQLRRLGASCDWSRERFTLDEGLSKAVLRVFVSLYREGLIYRDKRLVNWDPKFQTAISDLEVVSKEIRGHLWHIRYPVEGEDGCFITVATTRPETMLGDTAVAVHPEDERYTELVGKYCILPLVGRRIPIIADEYADPEQGSGAVKVTPAHDFNDFEVGRRHGLDMINILDAHARLSDASPEAYRGLGRFEGREKVIADLEAQGLVAEVEDHTHMVPFGDRSDVVIEPWLTDQWYVDAKSLAGPAIEAVERGETVFVPRNWEKTYFEWMRNIQPWCISRQLWWGHRIPAWYAEDGEIFVAESEEAAHEEAEKHYGRKVKLVQDEDVLDTWFSSALWPFSTLGWPDDTPELRRYYKTDVLITGFDIIFFWVARMMMMGLHFMKEVPFHTVYIHALVRDEKGQKMSKAKGNVVDPLALVDEFGADAVRFTLAAMAAQGRDIKLAKSRIEGYRNFGTKLWNAARFCQMNGCAREAGFEPQAVRGTVNRWIVAELTETAGTVAREIEAFRFNEAAGALYHFVWHVFCDWYLELAKPALGTEDPDTETKSTAAFVLDHILILLHPFMPFITEELWGRLAKDRGLERETLLIGAQWPEIGVPGDAPAAREEMDWLIGLVSSLRSVRAEMNVPPAARIPLMVRGGGPATADRLQRHEEAVQRLARIRSIERVEGLPPGAVQIVHGEATFILPLADVIDFNEEMKRLTKEISKLQGDLNKISAKLSNEKFLANAPEDVVEEQRERKNDAESRLARLQSALDQISVGVG